jgi:hypothetical protein
MSLASLKALVERAYNEWDDKDRARPLWIAERALEFADPQKLAPLLVRFAADLEFRQIARELLRSEHDTRNPIVDEPRQHPLFPGLQAKYPRQHTRDDPDPEYVKPELLSREDVDWNVSRMRAGVIALQRNADALEAWAQKWFARWMEPA